MLRFALVALAFGVCASAAAEEEAAPAVAEPAHTEPEYRRDGFVITNDSCGASRYAHLLGENYAELHQAALLPDNVRVAGRRSPVTTLEYEPAVLNVVLDESGRVIVIGCF